MFLGLDVNPQILDVFVEKDEIYRYLIIILPIIFGLISMIALFIAIKAKSSVKQNKLRSLKKVFTIVILFFILIIASNSDKKFDVVTIELTSPIKTNKNDLDYSIEELTELYNENLINSLTNNKDKDLNVQQLVKNYYLVDDKKNELELTSYDKTSGLNYYLHVSDTSKESLPLVIFLHGKSETGNMSKVKELKPVKAITDGTLEGLEDFVFLAPASPSRTLWCTDSALNKLMILLPEIIDNYHVDINRIYITGFSAGGVAVWSLVNKYPNTFRAAVTVSGTYNITPSNFKNTPIYAMAGSYESKFIGGMKKNVALINQAGGNALFKTIPNAGHAVTQMTYTTNELYTWLLSK